MKIKKWCEECEKDTIHEVTNKYKGRENSDEDEDHIIIEICTICQHVEETC